MKSLFAFLILTLSSPSFAASASDEDILRNDVIKATQAVVNQYYPNAPITYTRPVFHNLDVGPNGKSLVDVVKFDAMDKKNYSGCSVKIYFSLSYFTLHCDNSDRSKQLSIKAIMKPDLSAFEILGSNVRFGINVGTPQYTVKKGVVKLTRFVGTKAATGAIQSFQIQKFR